MYDVWEEAYYEKWTSRVGCDKNIPLRLFENFLFPPHHENSRKLQNFPVLAKPIRLKFRGNSFVPTLLYSPPPLVMASLTHWGN